MQEGNPSLERWFGACVCGVAAEKALLGEQA